MAFFHGVKTYEVPTAILPPRRTYAALPIVFGVAPIHRLPPEDQERVKPGKIQIIFSADEAAQLYGISPQTDDFEHWTLSEFAYCEFSLFRVAPAIFANLFDPAVHKKTVSNETVDMSTGRGRLANPDVVGSLTLLPAIGGAPFTEGVDYAFAPVTGVITALDGGSLSGSASATASYSYADPSMVTKADCIGGYDITTGITTGISLINQVFPKYRFVPTIGLAPKFGEDPEVAAVLRAACSAVNVIFKAVALCDIPSDGPTGIKHYSDAAQYKQLNNLVHRDFYLTWGKVKLGDKLMRMSTQAACVMASVDADYGDIPYASPSNNNLQMSAFIVDGKEYILTPEQANYLNSVGIATALNFMDGWKLWGNRTACFPDVTDPKDTFITSRRMIGWYCNHLILTWWQRVDWPMNRRLAQTIVSSEQVHLNSLTAREALMGGRIALQQDENAISDLIDGIITFHVYLGIVPPAEQIIFNVEWDTDYMMNLFTGITSA